MKCILKADRIEIENISIAISCCTRTPNHLTTHPHTHRCIHIRKQCNFSPILAFCCFFGGHRYMSMSFYMHVMNVRLYIHTHIHPHTHTHIHILRSVGALILNVSGALLAL